MLYIAAMLLVLIGFIHSILGEKYLLIRLFKRPDLPRLGGSDWFTKRVLRFAWHITTIAWWGIAAILFVIANPQDEVTAKILQIIALTFLLSGIISLVFSKGKHLSWVVFLAISGITFQAVPVMIFR